MIKSLYLWGSLIGACASLVHANPAIEPPSYADLQQQFQQVTHKNTDHIVLYVFFDSDSTQIKAPYQQMIQQLTRLMTAQEPFSLAISIVGYTDSDSSDQYNLALGQRRAAAVLDLIAPSLDKNFMISRFKSWGESHPLGDNLTAQGKQLNRRVEISIEIPQFGHPAFGQAANLSADGHTALMRDHNALVLWNAQAQCPQTLLTEPHEKILASAVSPNQRLALSGGLLSTLSLWDMATGTALKRLRGHEAPISAVGFSSSNELAISGSWDQQIKIWNLPQGYELQSLQGHASAVTAVAMGPMDKRAISGSADGEVIIWDLVEHKIQHKIQAHQQMVSKVAFTSNMRYAISSSMDHKIMRWDIQKAKPDYFPTAEESAVTSFDISPNNQTLLVAYANGTLEQWDIQTAKRLHQIKQPELKLISVAYHRQGELIMATDIAQNIHFWDAHSGQYRHHFATANWMKDSANTSTPTKNQTWHEALTGSSFVWVEGGCYQMGCGPWASQCANSEQPMHEVCVDGFWMAQNEVSQQSWQQIMSFNPSQKVDAQSPVNQVSWLDSQLFICHLNRETGQIYRLPTEAEWEYACRNQGMPQAYHDDAKEPLPLNNMNGAVWEWTLDAFAKESYAEHSLNNPLDAGDDSYHFLSGEIFRAYRGGSVDKGNARIQCTRRQYDDPNFRGFYTGFRLVKPMMSGE